MPGPCSALLGKDAYQAYAYGIPSTSSKSPRPTTDAHAPAVGNRKTSVCLFTSRCHQRPLRVVTNAYRVPLVAFLVPREPQTSVFWQKISCHPTWYFLDIPRSYAMFFTTKKRSFVVSPVSFGTLRRRPEASGRGRDKCRLWILGCAGRGTGSSWLRPCAWLGNGGPGLWGPPLERRGLQPGRCRGAAGPRWRRACRG